LIVNSSFLDGLTVHQAREKSIEHFEELGIGKRETNYRLRNLGYWGCPIPIIYCSYCGLTPIPENDLPVELPKDIYFEKPGNPLDNHPTCKHVDCPKCLSPATRETDTDVTFFESSWYSA
jgi:leucyl-tRNA synthetase